MLQQPLAWLRANMHLPYKVRFGGAKFGRGWGQLMYGSVMLLHAASAALISSCGNLVGHFFCFLWQFPINIAYYMHVHCVLPISITYYSSPISTTSRPHNILTTHQHSPLCIRIHYYISALPTNISISYYPSALTITL